MIKAYKGSTGIAKLKVTMAELLGAPPPPSSSEAAGQRPGSALVTGGGKAPSAAPPVPPGDRQPISQQEATVRLAAPGSIFEPPSGASPPQWVV